METVKIESTENPLQGTVATFSSISIMKPESREAEDSEGAIPWKRARSLVEKRVDAHCGEVVSSIRAFMGEIVGKGEKKRTCDDI